MSGAELSFDNPCVLGASLFTNERYFYSSTFWKLYVWLSYTPVHSALQAFLVLVNQLLSLFPPVFCLHSCLNLPTCSSALSCHMCFTGHLFRGVTGSSCVMFTCPLLSSPHHTTVGLSHLSSVSPISIFILPTFYHFHSLNAPPAMA